MTVTAYIGLGSNLHDPAAQVARALDELDALPGTRVTACSGLYRSAPVGFTEQPDFVNAVARLETALSPHDLLAALLDIEHRHGRVRHFRNGPRVIDLDVLLHGDAACHDAGLTLPHPRMHERAFVLRPLLEIAPDCVIPGRGAVADLALACAGQLVEPWTPEVARELA